MVRPAFQLWIPTNERLHPAVLASDIETGKPQSPLQILSQPRYKLCVSLALANPIRKSLNFHVQIYDRFYLAGK